MGLYEFKEFLTFEDVADYLRDKGVYDFDLNIQSDVSKLINFIFSMVGEHKITPVFKYSGLADIQCYTKSPRINMNGDIREEIYSMVELHQNVKICYHFVLDDIFFAMRQAISQHFELKGKGFFHWEDRETNYSGSGKKYKIKENFTITFDDVQYLKMDFDDLFSEQPNSHTEKLQTENDRLKAENERLTAELNKKPTTPAKDELTPKSQQAVAKLLYALLVEHGYELGAKKGNTNDILQSLTKNHDVELSREFIAKQLDEVNKLDKKNKLDKT